jgi:hypothetical protein
MIRLDLVKDYAPTPVWKKFYTHLQEQVHPQAATAAYVNTALSEYRAVYHMVDVGNVYESSVVHWIDFEDEELYAWFMLRWS